MPHIQIDDRTPSAYYTVGSTPQSAFVVPFAFFNDDDLDVFIDGVLKALNTHYTISGAGQSDGGTVIFLSAQSNCDIAIIRDVPIERTTDFPSSGPFDIDAVNTEFDRQVAMMQQIVAEHARVVTLDPSDDNANLILPAKASRLLKLLGFDSSGNLIPIDPSDVTLIVPSSASIIGKPMTGLLLANNAVTPNTKLDIAPGSARDKDQTVDIVLGSGLTKTTGAWAQGNNAGMLDAGSIAINSAYHTHLIYNPSTLAVDALASLSADSPTMPSAAWTKRRRLPCGFVTDGSGNIRPAIWRADRSIEIKDPITVTTNRSLQFASLLYLDLPIGVKLKAKCLLTVDNTPDSSPAFYVYFRDPDLGPPTNAIQATFIKQATFFGATVETWTDTSGRVYTWSSNATDADNSMNVNLQGWTDPLDEFA